MDKMDKKGGGMDDKKGGEMEKYLKNIKFPTDKNGVVNQAKQAGADNETVQMLQKLPNKEYLSMEEVTMDMDDEDMMM